MNKGPAMKISILLSLIGLLAGCDDKGTQTDSQRAAAAKQLHDGGNIITPSPKNWSWGDTPSQPQKKDQ
ncbi:hypothetical protein BOC41_02715 [Burkholderia pseudomallei]|nr:hypothetical protein BOC44_20360 [Burkholderia pseudomallei]OSP95488.1 hypothetical protein BOC41_02715 [Burkholderia pseudomallei]